MLTLTLQPPCPDEDLLRRVLRLLQQLRVEPSEVSQEQLYTLALVLKLLHDQEKTGNLATYTGFRNSSGLFSVPLSSFAPVVAN